MTSQSQDIVRCLTAREADAGDRLDRFLAANLAELSRSRLRRLIEAAVSCEAIYSAVSIRLETRKPFRR